LSRDAVFSDNLYRYCHNNPLKYVDTHGYDAEDMGRTYKRFELSHSQAKLLGEIVLDDVNDMKALVTGKTIFGESQHRGIAFICLVAPFGLDKAGKVAIKRIGNLKVSSLIKVDAGLIKQAEKMGKNIAVQLDSNKLIQEFLNGNTNPGIGSKNLFKDVNYLRGRNGARVFYRVKDGVMEILGKSSKANEQNVINILKKLYY
jgi:hypothetical protein